MALAADCTLSGLMESLDAGYLSGPYLVEIIDRAEDHIVFLEEGVPEAPDADATILWYHSQLVFGADWIVYRHGLIVMDNEYKHVRWNAENYQDLKAAVARPVKIPALFCDD